MQIEINLYLSVVLQAYHYYLAAVSKSRVKSNSHNLCIFWALKKIYSLSMFIPEFFLFYTFLVQLAAHFCEYVLCYRVASTDNINISPISTHCCYKLLHLGLTILPFFLPIFPDFSNKANKSHKPIWNLHTLYLIFKKVQVRNQPPRQPWHTYVDRT